VSSLHKAIAVGLGTLAFVVILWITERTIGLTQLPYAILLLAVTNPLGVIGTVFTYVGAGFNGLGPRKAIPYACFFLAGTTVANFQWHIAFDQDRSALSQYYFGAILLVPIASFIGLLSSIRYLAADRLLVLIIGMTVLLGLSQFLWEVEVLPVGVLNLYARAYAVTGMFLPFIALGWKLYAQRSKGAEGSKAS
jgi:hypothetical protein